MKLSSTLKSVAAAGLVLCGTASGFGITVSSTDQGVGVYTPTLQLGCTYLFEVSGTYGYGHNDWADAEFLTYYGAGPMEVHPLFSLSQDTLDLVVNGASVDWLGGASWTPHTYSPNHVYRYYFAGQGAPVHLAIADWQPLFPNDYTGDNSGALEVTITCVPDGGITMALLGLSFSGLACFRRKF